MSINFKKIEIGRHFTDDPSGRFYTDGDGSGEEFREEVLVPVLKGLNNGDKLIINIDYNVKGYGSSFLTEAFGGLVKYGYFSAEDVCEKIDIECNRKIFGLYKKKIFDYIKKPFGGIKEYKSTKEEAIRMGVFLGEIDKSFISDL